MLQNPKELPRRNNEIKEKIKFFDNANMHMKMPSKHKLNVIILKGLNFFPFKAQITDAAVPPTARDESKNP